MLPSTLELEPPLAWGDQRPRLEHAPPAFGTFGPMVIEFASAAGVSLDDWQCHVINGMFAVDAAGQWVSSEFGLLVSRQNGKGEILVAYDLAHLFMFPRKDNRRKTLLHSAHEVKTAIDGFQRLTGVIESKGKLMDRVEPNGIRIGNGQEGITLRKREGQLNGDRARFIARTKSSGRGFPSDTNVYDEAQEFSSSKRNALTYTLTQSPNKQEVFTGTVPSEENDAEVFEGVRDRGRGIRDQETGETVWGARTGWMEWSPAAAEDPRAIIVHPNVPVIREPGKTYIDLASHEVWRAANPAVNIRAFDFETIADEVERATDVVALARERFSVWPGKAEEEEPVYNELDLEEWDERGSPINLNGTSLYRVARPEAIAIAISRSGSYATVATAARYGLETIAVEHKATQAGTRWVAKFVADLKAKHPLALVVLDAKNASAILTSLTTLKVPYISMNINELTGAHSAFIEDNNGGFILHPNQPEVRASLQFAVPRAIGTAGYTWDASDQAKPVSHAQAVTWAHWGVRKLESAPPKEPAIVRGLA